ncbi:MAG: hypothetical protein ACYTG0_27250 [Planctomycetota bacterium]|jgi:hypothetical protein
MKHSAHTFSPPLVLAVVLGAFGPLGQTVADGAEYQPGLPFTYLFDTGTTSAHPLSGRAVSEKSGWAVVAEDDAGHAFTGDAVLLNDKLTVVLRARGRGAEVYTHTADGAKFRAVVMAATDDATVTRGWSGVRIVENSPGAVAVEVSIPCDGPTGSCSAAVRLTTGQSTLEMTAGDRAGRLFVWCRSRYVVVPDFFADDMVFDPGTCDRRRFALPAEDFLLHLLEGGGSMLMCVWDSGGLSERPAHALTTGEGPDRKILGCEVQGGKGKTLWVAAFERPGIWHERAVAAEKAGQGASLDWKPPFAARWRADAVGPDGFAVSSDSDDPDSDDWIVHTNEGPDPVPVIAYPLDRTPATPLTAFCPVDVLRNTLGVGPCQYILQAEGLASETNSTPDNVMTWVEKQFESSRHKEQAAEIKKRLDSMVEHVGHAQMRIAEYAVFARWVRETWTAPGSFERVVDRMQKTLPLDKGLKEPDQRARALADQVVALIDKDDALADCRQLGAALRGIGADQDRTLSKCRMAVRWMMAQCRMTAIEDPRSREPADRIHATAKQLLESP